MSGLRWLLYIGLPVALLAVYLCGMVTIPKPQGRLWYAIFSEQGVIEMATAALFFWASFAALRLYRQSRGRVPLRYRLIYLGFAGAACFVGLEEISYGQHLFRTGAPDWFAEHGTKAEINLHNLYDNMLAHRLNAVATAGFPFACIVLPLWARWKKRWKQKGHWVHYLLPKSELIFLVVLAQCMTWFDDVGRAIGSDNYWARATEMKELYWGFAAVCYLHVLRTRFLSWKSVKSTAAKILPYPSASESRKKLTRRAA